MSNPNLSTPADPQQEIAALKESYRLLKLELAWTKYELARLKGIPFSFHCKHIPTGENWHLLGINKETDEVCAAGWPPTIGKLSDCTEIIPYEPLTDKELAYRFDKFGPHWSNIIER